MMQTEEIDGDFPNLKVPRRAVVYVACRNKPADKPCISNTNIGSV
jgi:hypothetical protein